MAKIFNTTKVTVADLIQAIKDEDNGITYKQTARDIAKLPAQTSTTVVGVEFTAMQMAVSQCNRMADIIQAY